MSTLDPLLHKHSREEMWIWFQGTLETSRGAAWGFRFCRGRMQVKVLPLCTWDIQTLPCHLAPGTLNTGLWAPTLRQKTDAHSGSRHRIFDLLVNQTLSHVVVGNKKGQGIPHCGSLEPQAGSLQPSLDEKPSRLPSTLSQWPQGSLTVPKEDADSTGYFSAYGIFSIPSLYFIPLWGKGAQKIVYESGVIREGS